MSSVSYTALEGKSLSAVGVESPTFDSNDAGSLLTTSTFIYSLLFTAIIVAAFYRYVVAGVYRMQASEFSIRKSNEIFKQVTLGLLGVFSLFLILFTLNKGLVTGDVTLTGLKSSLPSGGGTGGLVTTSTGVNSPAPAAGTAPSSGNLQARIYSAAMSLKDNLSTKDVPGTNNGRLACAYAVNEVLKKAGINPIDRPGNLSVISMEAGLKGGRGQQINKQDTVQGDLSLEYSGHHVGVCLTNGCDRVISNSSSRGLFWWVSDPDFSASYHNGPSRFYRVTN